MSVKRPSVPKPYLLFVVFGFLVFGCAAATGPNDTGAGGPTKRGVDGPTEAREEPTLPTTMMFPEPPGSTLSYGGETVEGGLGSYCWTWGGGGGCADAFAIILGDETLEAPAGSTLSFAYRGKALDSLSVRPSGPAGRAEAAVAKTSSCRRLGAREKTSGSAAPGPGRASSPICPPASTCSTSSPGCPRVTPPTG